MNPPVDTATPTSAHDHGERRHAGEAEGTSGFLVGSDVIRGKTILVAEDDHSCRSALHQYFERAGYRVTEATDGPSTLRSVFQHSASLVILDLGLPGFDGMDVLAKIRRHSGIPIIVCSGRDSEEDRIKTLNLGADDFVVKPFSFAELEARVRAVLRRGNTEPVAKSLVFGDLVIDRDTRTVTAREGRTHDSQGVRPARLPGVVTRPGVLTRRPPRARWGSTEEWQGRSTVTEHVAPGQAQDRAGPRFAPVDHHCPRRGLPLQPARGVMLRAEIRSARPAPPGERW